VFAARAFKSALFGTPAASHEDPRKTRDKMATKSGTGPSDSGSGTPSKPPGILLTPGTSTSRRKRVSFGRDVPGSSEAGKINAMKATTSNRRTTLSEALENSRQKPGDISKADTRQTTNDSEDEWEEEEDDYCTNDITLDLNEPHSQSGRYWKGEFEKYHQEAKAEMEKLLKYKQLAKSYAQQKDAEAIQLAERLRDEQQKVINMEKRVADNASQIVSQKRQSADDEPTALLSKLAKQTSLAAQYRHRVQELEGDLAEFLEGAAAATGRPFTEHAEDTHRNTARATPGTVPIERTRHASRGNFQLEGSCQGCRRTGESSRHGRPGICGGASGP